MSDSGEPISMDEVPPAETAVLELDDAGEVNGSDVNVVPPSPVSEPAEQPIPSPSPPPVITSTAAVVDIASTQEDENDRVREPLSEETVAQRHARATGEEMEVGNVIDLVHFQDKSFGVRFSAVFVLQGALTVLWLMLFMHAVLDGLSCTYHSPMKCRRRCVPMSIGLTHLFIIVCLLLSEVVVRFPFLPALSSWKGRAVILLSDAWLQLIICEVYQWDRTYSTVCFSFTCVAAIIVLLSLIPRRGLDKQAPLRSKFVFHRTTASLEFEEETLREEEQVESLLASDLGFENDAP